MKHYKNSDNNYGIISKILHLLFIILFTGQYYLVYRREYFPEKSAESIQYILLHKSIGFTMLFLAIFAVLWALINKHPKAPLNTPAWEKAAAVISKILLYSAILLMPLSGALMSFYSGYGISWFGIPVINFFPVDKSLSSILYSFHVYFSYVIIALVTIHTIAALKHKFIYKNNVLQRMWKF